MLNVSNEQPNVQSAILPEAGPFALYVQLKVNANTADVLAEIQKLPTLIDELNQTQPDANLTVSVAFSKAFGCSSFQTTVHYPLMLLGRYSNAALIAAYETASSHQSRHWTLTSELLKGLRRHLAPILLLLYRGGH